MLSLGGRRQPTARLRELGCYDGVMGFGAPEGLTRLRDEELRTLLRAAHRGKLRYPLRRSDLLAQGLGEMADRADALLGLDERGLRTLLACVLAEREAVRRRLTRGPSS